MSAAWSLTDVDTIDVGRLEGIEIRGELGCDERVDVVRFESAVDMLAATGGCHVGTDGAIVSVRLDGRLVGPDGGAVRGWAIGTGAVTGTGR